MIMRWAMVSALIATACLQTPAKAAEDEYPGWVRQSATAASGHNIVDRAFECATSECAAVALRCVAFRWPANGLPNDVHQLLRSDHFAVGQFTYWLAADLMEERSNLLRNQPDIEGPSSLDFVPMQLSGRDTLSSQFELRAGDETLRARVTLWYDDAQLRGLRCSHVGAQNSDAYSHGIALLKSMLSE